MKRLFLGHILVEIVDAFIYVARFGTCSPLLTLCVNSATMTISNILTIIRICICPFFLWFFLEDDLASQFVVLGLYIIAELTDFFDGYLARRFQWISTMGKILDPFADNAYRFTAFIAILAKGYCSVWFIALIFYRESLISTLRIFAASQNVIIHARKSGKLKAVYQAFALGVIILIRLLHTSHPMSWFTTVTNVMMGSVAVVTVLSALDYLHSNRAVIYKILKDAAPTSSADNT